ncbi:hypothetical protein [Salinimicrobium oceani]|uniref:PKD domain-containing protein n=1 Tax=Salinimicrobium oceani TaxID=2722702 RepID=A0ABX1CV13_9FLAO|nr:hypothetical protein [Salinimicrobium oceani]NJW52130.1 hypothetical protein [Salinimicrobium oceani]
MKTKFLLGISLIFASLLLFVSCSEEEYEMGELAAPTNLVVETELVGQDEEHPYGDGSGEVKITVTGDNALAYKIDYGLSENLNLVSFGGQTTRKYTRTGVNTYTLTIVAYGPGGTATNITHDITVESVFTPEPRIITALVGEGSKTWVVDKSTSGHFGVGPWSDASTWPEWWSAGVNEKVGSADCFYSATFTFSQESETSFSLSVDTPEGAFTKTGGLTSLPGIPASGDEGCYDYGGGASDFSFIPSSTGIPASTPSTRTSIELAGNSTFIGYGAVQKEYEILEITPDVLYLRVQGTETGNAWYIRLIPAE